MGGCRVIAAITHADRPASVLKSLFPGHLSSYFKCSQCWSGHDSSWSHLVSTIWHRFLCSPLTADIWQTSLRFVHLLLLDCDLLSAAQTCENIVLLLATESLLARFA